jgi:serine phosphatase RsbU (regulator of sigma subunit)/pSer/pThr/pTyr-binding forkhead associated (FHA) protein
MLEHSTDYQTVLEVAFPGRPNAFEPVTQSPFLIGRGSDTGNHLQLEDRRISRRCAAIVAGDSGYRIEDRGHRQGIFVNGERIDRKDLQDGDLIQFGLDDCYEITFHSSAARASIESMLTRIGSIPALTSTLSSPGLSKLNLLLEATSLLHSQLPLDSVLSTMLDHAISITKADRGLLLEPDGDGPLKLRLARSSKGENLPADSIAPSQTALRQAIDRQSGVITGDLNMADLNLKSAQSIVVQNLRSVVAIPLYAMPRANSDQSIVLKRGQLLGAVYLDSRHPAAFSDVDRQILDALGMEAASILDNARLVERERDRQRLEQELTIARDIQQALLPQGLNDFPHLAVTGVHYPCHSVGGDYFDVFPINEDRTAFLIADVSGKGLGAALLTTMLQGALSAMTLGTDPVRVFNHINKFLCQHAEVGRYATMFFGIIDRDGTLEFIKGGHPSPLLIRHGKVSDLYTEGSFPVGLVAEAHYTASTLKLEPEDTLVLFSDGITEAENPERELFGFPRLHQVLTGWQDESLESIQKIVLESVDTFCRGAAQADDMTLLVVRYRASAQNAPPAA